MTIARELIGQRLLATARVAATFVGTVVGAGFASGQEVLQFFSLYGARAVWGILLAGGLLGLFGYLVLKAGNDFQARSHRDVLDGLGTGLLVPALDGLITVFLFGGLAAMAAGAGAALREQLGLPALLGSTLLVAAAAATVLFGLRSVVNAISAVAPFLVASVLAVSIGSLSSRPLTLTWAAPERAFFPSWLLAAAAYGSYNLVLSLSVLGPLGRTNPRDSLLPGAVLGATVLAGCALAIHLALLTLAPDALTHAEVPMVAAARRLAPALGTLYVLVLLAEVYTTAVGNLFGLAARLRGRRRGSGHDRDPVGEASRDPAWVRATLGAAGLAWLVAQFGFASLVRNLYSVMGVAGSLLLAALLWRALAGHARS